MFHSLAALCATAGTADARPGLEPPSRIVREVTRTVPGLIWDGSLSKAAEHHAREVLAHPGKARLEQVKDALAREGVADATVLPFSRIGQVADTWLPAARQFGRSARDRGFNRLGFAELSDASKTRGAPKTVWVMLLTRRLAALSPLPRRSGPAGVRIAGRVHGPYELLLLTPCADRPDCPNGRVLQIATGSGGTLGVQLPPLDNDQRHVLELLVETRRGPEVAALWTFGPRWPRRPAEEPLSESRPKAFLRLLASARSHAEVAPVSEHPALDRAARAHADSVCRHRVAAHVSKDNRGPMDRARAAGYRGRVSENIAVASSVDRAHVNLMRSPGHRRVRLDPFARHVGQAVVLGAPLKGLLQPVCVVEVFGRPDAN